MQALLITVLVATMAAPRQDSPVSSAGGIAGQSAAPATSNGEVHDPLPASLERVRELLALPVPLQESLGRRPTFKIEVEEHRQVQELLSLIEFDHTRPAVPAAGVYGYETQRVMMSSLSTPLTQPYAVFGSGELLTLAFEGLLQKYLGWRALDKISAADRGRAEAAARAEVSHAVSSYCAGLPDKGEGIRLCAGRPSP